jgi:hypothetical protein
MEIGRAMLLAEAEQLLARVERKARQHREEVARLEARAQDAREARERAVRAEREVKRLHLYYAVLQSSNPAHAIMPEYLTARGLVRLAPDTHE